MPIIKITEQGLMAIAFSVALLWACLIGERAMVRQAQLERARVMRDFERFQRQQRTEPVAVPVRLRRPHAAISAG